MSGIIFLGDIEGPLDAKNIAMCVLRGAIELTDLKAVCGSA
jgi:hypothetical protein